jgi:E3 ubiquitin-protein ligase NEDD4
LFLHHLLQKGGLKREFFQLISDELFDIDTGLWMTCGENQMSLQVHPMSGA